MSIFKAVHGFEWYGLLAGSAVLFVVLLAGLQALPARFRRYIILGVTFFGGLFYALEFFWPTHAMPTPDDPQRAGNFLTPFVPPFTDALVVISALTVGLGVINLVQIHGKRIARRRQGWINSLAFFAATAVMFVLYILANTPSHANTINKSLNEIVFAGYTNMSSTMFSIIAFYIVSAAYRAFRVRSVEATLLLLTAIVVMLGQTVVGQKLTDALPIAPVNAKWYLQLGHDLRIEVIRDWIMNKANAPVTRAISFGLGIGSLAVALRIWLGLERGSYFDSQG